MAPKDTHDDPEQFALVHAGLGENHRAFESLERALKERSPSVVYLKMRPEWNLVRDGPRFQALLEKCDTS